MDVIKFGDHHQQQQQQQLHQQSGENVKTTVHWEPGESNQLQQHQQVEHSKHQESTSCLNTPSTIQQVPSVSPFIGLSKFGVITSDKTHHRLVNDNSYSLAQSYSSIVENQSVVCNHRRQNALYTSPPDTFTKDCNRHLPIPNVIHSNSLDSANFIRRRNERERARVKNVNEGFDRLRKHLPLSQSQREKRLSKVETLRMAISYIRHLETVLKSNDSKEER